MSSFDGKVAVVTGAANGIGETIARRLHAAGARLALIDRDGAAVAALAGALGALPLVADVSDEDQMKNAFRAIETQFSGVDLAFLNAGVEGEVAPMRELPVDTFDKVMAVNVRGVWLGIVCAAGTMKPGGAIVAMSSVAGLRGRAGLAAYSASKHAVLGLVRSAALELQPEGIRVNALCPGPTETRMMQKIDAGDRSARGEAGTTARPGALRYATTAEIASAALFLASDEASYITGTALTVDGGVMAGRAQ